MECWKNGYTTEKEARTVANYRHRKKNQPKLHVYKCWNCHKWHLTKRDQTKNSYTK